jgi:metallo-beta-lactamase class B
MRLLAFCLLAILLGSNRSVLAEELPPSSWTTPIAPFQIADRLYYVGSQDLASYLVVTAGGNILINANLDSSPPQIRASIEKLGFRWSDTRILLNSQAHSDHVGGAAEVIRETRAKNMVMEGDAEVVETGGRADFLSPSPNIALFAAVHADRVLHDKDTVELGGVSLTAHKTAGHTRGCTTWTLRDHVSGEPAGQTRLIVIVGGTGFWSEYHFTASPGHRESYPGIAQDFERTFARLHELPAEIFLGAHGGYFDLLAKLERYPKEGPPVFLDHAGYEAFVNESEATFRDAVRKQKPGN